MYLFLLYGLTLPFTSHGQDQRPARRAAKQTHLSGATIISRNWNHDKSGPSAQPEEDSLLSNRGQHNRPSIRKKQRNKSGSVPHTTGKSNYRWMKGSVTVLEENVGNYMYNPGIGGKCKPRSPKATTVLLKSLSSVPHVVTQP